MEMAMISFILIIITLIFAVISLAANVFLIIGHWKVFEKANKPGWAAIVPYYNLWILYELGDFSPYLIFLTVGMSLLSFVSGFMVPFIEYSKINMSFLLPISMIINTIVIIAAIAVMVINIMVNLNIAKKFNKSAGFGVGLALLPYVFYPILGFDKNAVYNKEAK